MTHYGGLAIGFAFDPEFKNIEKVKEGHHQKRAA